MDNQRKFYWLWGAIGLLLLLNVLTVVWVVRRTAAVRTNRALPERVMARRLDFTPQQLKLYRQSRVQLRQQAKPHEDSLRTLRMTLLDLTRQSAVSEVELDRLLAQMARQNGQITRLRLRHWQQVRALCTPEQQVRFDTLIRRVGQGMNSPGLRGQLPARGN